MSPNFLKLIDNISELLFFVLIVSLVAIFHPQTLNSEISQPLTVGSLCGLFVAFCLMKYILDFNWSILKQTFTKKKEEVKNETPTQP